MVRHQYIWIWMFMSQHACGGLVWRASLHRHDSHTCAAAVKNAALRVRVLLTLCGPSVSKKVDGNNAGFTVFNPFSTVFSEYLSHFRSGLAAKLRRRLFWPLVNPEWLLECSESFSKTSVDPIGYPEPLADTEGEGGGKTFKIWYFRHLKQIGTTTDSRSFKYKEHKIFLK